MAPVIRISLSPPVCLILGYLAHFVPLTVGVAGEGQPAKACRGSRLRFFVQTPPMIYHARPQIALFDLLPRDLTRPMLYRPA